MFRLDEKIQKIMEEKFEKEEEEMSNIPRVAREIYENGVQHGREEERINSKVYSIKRILTKKLNEVPSNKIVSKLEKLTINELEEIEDRILEIESWEEI